MFKVQVSCSDVKTGDPAPTLRVYAHALREREPSTPWTSVSNKFLYASMSSYATRTGFQNRPNVRCLPTRCKKKTIPFRTCI